MCPLAYEEACQEVNAQGQMADIHITGSANDGSNGHCECRSAHRFQRIVLARPNDDWSKEVVAPISPLGANHTSLRLWAAYSDRGKGELRTEPEPVTPPPVVHAATLESVPKPATLEMSAGLHVMTCKCTLCSPGMETIASPVGGAKIVPVNLTGEMTPEEKEMIEKLRQRDAQVRRHEQAHLVAAGQHAMGGAQYTYQVGPDGRRYAVGGEVQVDVAPVEGDPEATLRKAQQLQRAALAPMDPSAADRNVASVAAQMAQEARQDIAEEAQEAMRERREGTEEDNKSDSLTGEKAENVLAPPESIFPGSLYGPEAEGTDELASAAQKPGPESPADHNSEGATGLDLYA